MSLEYVEHPDSRTIELTVNGRVTREDFDAVIDKVQGFIDTHGTIRVLEVIESFEGFDVSVLWPGIKFDIRNIRHVSHVAVVSDIGWMTPISKAAGAVISSNLRTFDLAELSAARDWIATAH